MILVIAVYFSSVLVCACASSVPTYKLNDGHDIPAIALGTWAGFTVGGTELKLMELKDNETENAVLWALEAGYRHIDTASIYEQEDQIGRALRRKFSQGLKRKEVFVTSKVWNDAHARDAVVPALQRSLQDLNLDYVDLYLIHCPVGQFKNGTHNYIDYVETWRGMMDAKDMGLTISIGVSNFNKEQITRLMEQGLEKPAVLQIEVNLNIQQPELLSYCKEQNIAVTGYTPFGSLFYNRAKPDAPPPRVDDPALVRIAHKYNKTVPQVNLRYLVELGVIPLPKSGNKSQIEENINVFDFQLSGSERELLRSYDRNYKTIPNTIPKDHPYYPFKKNHPYYPVEKDATILSL